MYVSNVALTVVSITEVVATNGDVITDLRHIGSCDPLHVFLPFSPHVQFYTGKSPKGSDVFLKLYIDPAYDKEGSYSIDSDNSMEYYGATTGNVLSNLRNEVMIVHMLFHDHIVFYYNEIDMGTIYGYSMEYCPGGTLHDFIQTHGSLSPSQVRTLMEQMLEALKYLAEKRVVHRDIKTANILIVREGMYKLCDFGSACVLSNRSRDTIINDGQYIGTAQYIAPESGRGMQRGRSDVWSLGCCFYEAVTGQEPWRDILKKCHSRDSVVLEIMNQRKAPTVPPDKWSQMDENMKDFYRRIFELVGVGGRVNRRMKRSDRPPHSCYNIPFCYLSGLFVARNRIDGRNQERLRPLIIDCSLVAESVAQHVGFLRSSSAPHIRNRLHLLLLEGVQERREDLPGDLQLVATDEVAVIAANDIQNQPVVRLRQIEVVFMLVGHVEFLRHRSRLDTGRLHVHLHVDCSVRLHAQHQLVPIRVTEQRARHVLELNPNLSLRLVQRYYRTPPSNLPLPHFT